MESTYKIEKIENIEPNKNQESDSFICKTTMINIAGFVVFHKCRYLKKQK